MSISDRDLAVKYAWGFVGLPYIWGGDDSIEGFDCSGFLIEIMAGIGKLKRGRDYRARDLYYMWAIEDDYHVGYRKPGVSVFFIDELGDGVARHVAFMVSEHHIIHAAGGGSGTLTIADAIKHNAYIKLDNLDNEQNRRKAAYGQYVSKVDVFQ